MKKTIMILLWLTGLLLQQPLAFGQKHTMAELKPVFDRLRSLTRYSYENHTRAIFPNGQRDELVTSIYMDKPGQRVSYSNKGETLLLNRNWIFKLNHTEQIAQVFKLSVYKKQHKGPMGDVSSLFNIDMVGYFMDSLVMRSGRLVSVEKQGVQTTYKVAFPAESSLREMRIVFNEQTQLPDNISFRVVQGSGSGQVSSDVVCNHYSTTLPETIFDERTYFTIVKGKPVLTRNRNYKVYSAL